MCASPGYPETCSSAAPLINGTQFDPGFRPADFLVLSCRFLWTQTEVSQRPMLYQEGQAVSTQLRLRRWTFVLPDSGQEPRGPHCAGGEIVAVRTGHCPTGQQAACALCGQNDSPPERIPTAPGLSQLVHWRVPFERPLRQQENELRCHAILETSPSSANGCIHCQRRSRPVCNDRLPSPIRGDPGPMRRPGPEPAYFGGQRCLPGSDDDQQRCHHREKYLRRVPGKPQRPIGKQRP